MTDSILNLFAAWGDVQIPCALPLCPLLGGIHFNSLVFAHNAGSSVTREASTRLVGGEQQEK